MKHVAAIVSTLCLLLGGAACSNQERAEKERQKAVESQKEAKEDLAKGQKEAAEKMGEAKKEAAGDLKEAREHNKEAAEAAAKANDTKPVAGRDEDRRKSIADKLGNDWTVTREGNTWVAERHNAKNPPGSFEKAFDAAKAKLRKDYHDLNATVDHGVIRMSGRLDNCDELDNAIDTYADLDGVSKIYADVSCPVK
jgi:aldehyde:ferredoxin oxidoreductase